MNSIKRISEDSFYSSHHVARTCKSSKDYRLGKVTARYVQTLRQDFSKHGKNQWEFGHRA